MGRTARQARDGEAGTAIGGVRLALMVGSSWSTDKAELPHQIPSEIPSKNRTLSPIPVPDPRLLVLVR